MKFRLLIEFDAATKRWSAVFPELPGCATAGDSEAVAVEYAREALSLWFEPAPVKLHKGAKIMELAVPRVAGFQFCSANEVIKVLRQHDYVMDGQAGSHQKWRHENGRQVIVALHGSKPIPIGALKSIIEGSGLDTDEFR